MLEDIIHDPKTGRMSFRAMLPDYKYEFEGALTDTRITGVITATRAGCQECRENIKVVLPRKREGSGEMSEYKTLKEWNAMMDGILARRGPRE